MSVGITVDKHLAFDNHIQLQVNKENQIARLTYKIFSYKLIWATELSAYFSKHWWASNSSIPVEEIENIKKNN